MINNKSTIEAVHEEMADKTRVAKIRFEALVEMHDAAFPIIEKKTILFPERTFKKPQWFKSYMTLSLELIKHGDPMAIGYAIKNQLHELEATIKKIEENY